MTSVCDRERAFLQADPPNSSAMWTIPAVRWAVASVANAVSCCPGASRTV